ncbi:galectin-8-like isoform X3 [Rhodnius prolixus]|uniref:galectin-8-like isoform X3 n=1 Tax=Rhodnius prolixus TaxID=13249 RepID=UPI003D18926D
MDLYLLLLKVRNSYFNGEWGQEEVHATKKNPFKRGQMFIMEIYVMKSEYLVSVNGVHFCSFVHRIQPSSVDSIHINGDVQLLKLELSKREMYPSTERTLLLVDDPHNKMLFPFYHELKYPIMEKWDLTITGTILEFADRFVVDFCGACDKCTRSHKNIIFHLNPRLTQNYVARNSYLHEQWGLEESHAIQRNPFMRGQTFILEIFVTASDYMISVNGVHFCSYQHRFPPSAVESFEVRGDVALKRIDLCRKDTYPTKKETLYPDLNQLEEQFSQPIIHSLSKPLTMDTIIEIDGRVPLLPHEFHINLQNATTAIPHPIIPYHISLRWQPETTNSTVVNSWISGQWDEESVFGSLLRPNYNFKITIYVKKEGYSTVIKAPVKPYSTVLPFFVHKTDPSIINYLYIQGDVKIFSIQVSRI